MKFTAAFRRGGLDAEAVLASFQDMIEGNYRNSIVDLDVGPGMGFLGSGWSVLEHKGGGFLDLRRAKFALHCVEYQERGMRGVAVHERLGERRVMNAALLDWFLRDGNQHMIPEEWGGKAGNGRPTHVYFWGTIYHRADGQRCVRYLHRDGRRWYDHYLHLESYIHVESPALELVS